MFVEISTSPLCPVDVELFQIGRISSLKHLKIQQMSRECCHSIITFIKMLIGKKFFDEVLCTSFFFFFLYLYILAHMNIKAQVRLSNRNMSMA